MAVVSADLRPSLQSQHEGVVMTRPRLSTLVAIGLAAAMAVLLVAAVLLGRSAEPCGRTVVTVRLWDEQVAAAYRESFGEFTRENPEIEVRINVVAYSNYFDTLRTDVAGGSADDISGSPTPTSPATPTAFG
jgi:multiple sugar transport system substrate-binding protein